MSLEIRAFMFQKAVSHQNEIKDIKTVAVSQSASTKQVLMRLVRYHNLVSLRAFTNVCTSDAFILWLHGQTFSAFAFILKLTSSPQSLDEQHSCCVMTPVPVVLC